MKKFDSNQCDIIMIVTTYKKNYTSQSESLKCISKLKTDNSLVKVAVWNNGPDDIVDDLKFGDRLSVVNSPTNESLATAYNYWIDHCIADYYIILDDDTSINQDLISELQHNHSLGNSDKLMLPRMKCNHQIISPVKDFSAQPLRKGYNNSKGFRAIGSGLIIPNSIALKWKGKLFDDNLNLYGIDTVFCYDYATMFDGLIVLKTCINHDVAGLSNITVESYAFREKNLLSAMLYIFFKYPKLRFLYLKRIAGLLFKYVYLVRSFDIFRTLILALNKR
ncbi:glycosyltransferase [Vibrio splendidus]|uniref:glycosyltransferase n=1 Tax=Vibrio splendidus TaxID=29497 RepID=UPI000C81F8A9|nr:glycosyltransferase [Vibrio splendidus]PMO71085.1 hypothetical protein BCT03_20255 [Vibrio splendidus]